MVGVAEIISSLIKEMLSHYGGEYRGENLDNS
jgi:hypothetical protein